MTSHDDIIKLLDIVSCSMDFGSGFLDNEEVAVIRRIAADHGLDPEDFTPSNMTHHYKQTTYPGHLAMADRCQKCYRVEDDPIHGEFNGELENEDGI